MDAITIFIVDHIIQAFIACLMIINIYTLCTRKRSRPKYRQDQRVLGQNYRTKNGSYVLCKIIRVTTVWHVNGKFDHVYECGVLDQQHMILELTEERLLPA